MTSGPTLALGVIGDNIAASSAPRLHGLAGELTGVAVTYDLLVPRELERDFDGTLAWCRASGYHGVNVTYPYKELAATRVRIADPEVRAVGAVNTIVFDAAGPAGFNTDRSGFLTTYASTFGDASPGTVCLIGAGGVGRAVAFALARLGAPEIRLVERDGERAATLAEALGAHVPGLRIEICADAPAGAEGADGLVNCTPVGMVGHDGTVLVAAAMRGARWAFDAVYTPVETTFVTEARAAGLEVMTGYELFFHQGVDAWRIYARGSGARTLDAAALRAALADGAQAPS